MLVFWLLTITCLYFDCLVACEYQSYINAGDCVCVEDRMQQPYFCASSAGLALQESTGIVIDCVESFVFVCSSVRQHT